MATAMIGNTPFYYEVSGSGDPVLFVAGLASDSLSWQGIVRDMARRFTVITFDHRGVGRTPLSGAEISISGMADDCIGLMNHLGAPSAGLVGHSMGGFVALDLAARYPRAVDKLVLAGTSMANSKRNKALLSDWSLGLETGMDPELWFRNIFYWVFSPEFFEDEDMVRELIRFELAYPYPIDKVAFKKQVEAIIGFDRTEHAPRVASETLVIAGENDLLITPGESRALAEAIPRARFHLMKKAAHSMYVENPRGFTDCLLDFLSDGR